MTGTFSIKRRKQMTLRPDGQSSQSSVLPALGIGVGRSSAHTASKRGHIHVADLAASGEIAFAKAQEWHLATGRPLPPHMKVRRPLPEPAPLGVQARAAHYGVTGKDAQAILGDPSMTPARRRRLLRKAGSHGERPAGWSPQRAQPGPRAPRTPAQRARAKRNAAQQARHLDRLR